jgi:hypothetical protein
MKELDYLWSFLFNLFSLFIVNCLNYQLFAMLLPPITTLNVMVPNNQIQKPVQ